MPYKFLEGVAMADVAFEASGKTLRELFESGALAVTNTMVKDLDSVKTNEKRKIEVESDTVEMLFFNFLQEIVFYKDAEQLLLSKFELDVYPENGKWKAVCEAYGEKLDAEKHELVVDVKAVTLHMFEVKETKDGWMARVILDI